MEEILRAILLNYKKIIFPIIGFFIGLFLIKYGVLKTLVVIISTFLGYFISNLNLKFNLKKWIIDKLIKGEE